MELTAWTEYRGELQGCQCLQLPEGILLRDDRYRSYLEHLVYVSGGTSWDATGYYLCPNTGVVWMGTYVGEEPMPTPAVVRTRCRQLPLDAYTIAKGAAQLYSEPVYPPPEAPRVDYQLPRGVSPPPFPELPLQGLFYESFFPRSELLWACEDIQVRGSVPLKVWLHLLVPLSRGETGACWLASPLELISQQVLQSGLVLAWWFAGGQIGEVRVEVQERVSAARFFEWFGFDKPYRNTGKEFSLWLQAVRRGKRRG